MSAQENNRVERRVLVERKAAAEERVPAVGLSERRDRVGLQQKAMLEGWPAAQEAPGLE